MYLPIYSPTRSLLRLKYQGIQVYKKEISGDTLNKLKSLEDVKRFISNFTKFKKEFDSYHLETLDQVLTNPEGY